MSIPFFYESEINSNHSSFTMSEESSKHVFQVLRMKPFESIHITNGKGLLCTGIIQNADKKSTTVKIESFEQQNLNNRKVSIAVSLLKNSNRFEWMIEKITELGVSEIIPLVCKRTEREFFRVERMKSIVVSAMLQSQQTWLPILCNPTPFLSFLEEKKSTQKLIAHCEPNQKKSIADINFDQDITILIGPEGDFTSEEITAALQKQYIPIMLGNTRLRTETAAVTAAALVCIAG